MSRFEKRVTDEQVARARERIAEGATLRATAAEIPCAPSTLSYRIRRVEGAESAAAEPVDAEGPAVMVTPVDGGGVGGDQLGPLQVLREALQATKSDGQPHWPTRISAARTLAALRPEELEPKQKQRPRQPEIVVYDLPPGSNPVTHRALDGAQGGEPEIAPAEVEESADSQPAGPMLFYYGLAEDKDNSYLIGSWTPPQSEAHEGYGTVTFGIVSTGDREVADQWREDLAAGRLPETEDEP